jgi:hypothetical protein
MEIYIIDPEDVSESCEFCADGWPVVAVRKDEDYDKDENDKPVWWWICKPCFVQFLKEYIESLPETP